IVLLVILCAGALAFVVIYNLTNINITERRREIATIKVLGFYPGETAMYVFGENFVLTALGALLGIPLGRLLHLFVMSKINIDMVSFDVKVTALSVVFSVVLTFVFSVAVDFLMYFKLQKIDMAQSLKSVE
ncbi:MAG: ABC transporter permease, partial [Acutalibacteraceae bacterium]